MGLHCSLPPLTSNSNQFHVHIHASFLSTLFNIPASQPQEPCPEFKCHQRHRSTDATFDFFCIYFIVLRGCILCTPVGSASWYVPMVKVSEHATGKVAAVEGRPAVELKGTAATNHPFSFSIITFRSRPALLWAYSYPDSFATNLLISR